MTWDPQAWKQEVLRHCLWMAAFDPDYAIWAAGWYEENEKWLLTNLQAKVKQEIARAARRGTDGSA